MTAATRPHLVLALLALAALASAARAAEAPTSLKVSENKRFLVRDDGTPFFYLGDTAWELFHRLTREEAEMYLTDRASKGFTVIQAVALAEFGGLTDPNRYGHLPLVDKDPTKPVEEYFQHVDWVVDRANQLGLVVALLPTWGDKVNKKWGQGPEIFVPQNAGPFGEYLGRRYKNKGVIWMLGGDRAVEKPEQLEVWRAMAAGLKKGDGGRHLITYHTQGGQSSSLKLHDEPWLDFNTFQSGHGQKNNANWDMLRKDYDRKPTKPCLDAEPNYENHPVRGKKEQGWFDEYDVRKAAYWSLFAGACGHTYGCHDVWMMYVKGEKNLADARTGWRDAIKLPGATQVGYARKLIESRPQLARVPDQSLVVGDPGKGGQHVQATRDDAGTYAFVYFPTRREVTVDTTKLKGPLRAAWFNPRTGKAAVVDQRVAADKPASFEPPKAEDGSVGDDWVLILDSAGKNYPLP
jgi:hypothetical protein